MSTINLTTAERELLKLEAIIANAVDTTVGAVRPDNQRDIEMVANTLGLNGEQARDAIAVTKAIAERDSWGN